MAGTTLFAHRLPGVKTRGWVGGTQLIVGIVARDADLFLLRLFDRLAAVSPLVDLRYHVLMASATLIKAKEATQGFVDIRRIRMRVLLRGGTVTFNTGGLSMH